MEAQTGWRQRALNPATASGLSVRAARSGVSRPAAGEGVEEPANMVLVQVLSDQDEP